MKIKTILLFMVMMSIFILSCTADDLDLDVNSNDNGGTPDDGETPDDPKDNDTFTEPWDGEATDEPKIVDDVYQINSASEFAWLGGQANITQDIKFMANIDMGNELFLGITNFNGVMDGNNKSIINLNIDTGNAAVSTGLILKLSDGGEIKNLSILSGTIKGRNSVGAFVGEATGTVSLTGLLNKADVEALSGSVGGIIGTINKNTKITINSTQNQGNIKAELESAGGIIGFTSVVTDIINVGNTGTVVASNHVGGIIGARVDNNNNITIEYAYNYGAITARNGDSGAIVGNLEAITINSFYLEGTAIQTGVTSLTEAEFMIENSFSGWDFDKVWEIVEDGKYPTLR